MYLKDIETFDLEDFKYNSVNITAFRLVDVESPKVVDIMEQMKKFQHTGKDISNGSSVIMVKFPLHKSPKISTLILFFSLLSSPSYAILRIFTQHVFLYIFLMNLMTTQRAIQLSCLMPSPCTLMDWLH